MDTHRSKTTRVYSATWPAELPPILFCLQIDAGRLTNPLSVPSALQWYLVYEKTPPPRTLQYGYAYGPMVGLGGGAFSYERGAPVMKYFPTTEQGESPSRARQRGSGDTPPSGPCPTPDPHLGSCPAPTHTAWPTPLTLTLNYGLSQRLNHRRNMDPS